MAEFIKRVHPSTAEILRWSEAKAIELGQPNIDTTHLMHACLVHNDIRDWLRRIDAPVETTYLLMSLKLPQKEEKSSIISDEGREKVGLLVELGLFSPARKSEGLTDRTNRAIKVAGEERSRFESYYLHPIHIFAGIVQADELLTEHVLLGERLTRTRLMEEIEAEEQRAKLSETLTNVKRYMESDVDFAKRLEIARQIEGLIN